MARQMNRRGFLAAGAATAAAGAVGLGAPARGLAGTLFGPPPGMIKLSSNENPYGPSPAALEAIAKTAKLGAYYAWPATRELTERIAAANDLPPECVVVTSGSSSVLQASAKAFSAHGAILLPELTFDSPLQYAQRLGAELRRVDLAPDMGIDLPAMKAALHYDVGLVYVCNPNNPTGVTLPPDALRGFCHEVSRIAPVLVDEAYNELTDDPAADSMVGLVREGESVIVTRTFSKIYGLAGLRIGYALAPPALAEVIRRHAMSASNALGLAAALASYEDEPFLAYSKSKIREGREMVLDLYQRLEVPALPSQTNFVYADLGRDADAFRDAMKAHGIMIRGVYRDWRTWSRVSMGRLEDVAQFVRAFEQVYTA